MSVLDKKVTPLVRRVTLCLDGALQGEHDSLQRALVEASFADKAEQSLASDNVARVVEQMENVRVRMLDAQVTYSFRSLNWFRKMSLQAEHPSRDGNLVDRGAGYNVETYIPALIRESCCSVQDVVTGEIETEIPAEYWDDKFGAEGLGFPQVDVLFGAANEANESATTVPPSARSWLEAQDSGASLKPPGPGTSHRNGSKGGSSPTARKSSTTTKADSLP